MNCAKAKNRRVGRTPYVGTFYNDHASERLVPLGIMGDLDLRMTGWNFNGDGVAAGLIFYPRLNTYKYFKNRLI